MTQDQSDQLQIIDEKVTAIYNALSTIGATMNGTFIIPEIKQTTLAQEDDTLINPALSSETASATAPPPPPNNVEGTVTDLFAAMRLDSSKIPDVWDRPYPEPQPKKRAAKTKAFEDAVEQGDEKAVAVAGVPFAKFMLDKAKRNLRRLKNIETTNTTEADDKTKAQTICEIDIDRWNADIKQYEAVIANPVPKMTPPPPPPADEQSDNAPNTTKPVEDVRDLPEGYAFVDGTPPDDTFEGYETSGWSIDQMLQHGKIRQLDRANECAAVVADANTPTDAIGMNAYIAKIVSPDTNGMLRNMTQVMAAISKYGQGVEAVPVEQYPNLIADFNNIPLIAAPIN